MQKIAIGLSALLLIAATSKPGTAQEASAVVHPTGVRRVRTRRIPRLRELRHAE